MTACFTANLIALAAAFQRRHKSPLDHSLRLLRQPGHPGLPHHRTVSELLVTAVMHALGRSHNSRDARWSRS